MKGSNNPANNTEENAMLLDCISQYNDNWKHFPNNNKNKDKIIISKHKLSKNENVPRATQLTMYA